jgi:transposase
MYTVAFRARMVRRMMSPPAISVRGLARETGLSQGTLSRWVREARRFGQMMTEDESPEPEPPADVPEPKKWTTDEKLRVLVEAQHLEGEGLGAFLRKEGLHAAQVQAWRDALGAEEAPAGAERLRILATERRVKELERELRRKDKALAEAAALLLLEKKLQSMGWDDEGGGTNGENEK